MFSRNHLIAIGLTIGLIAGLTRWITRGGPARSLSWLKFIALIGLVFDPLYWWWEWRTFGRFHWESTLPIYLCSLFWLLMPLAVFGRPGQVRQTARANIATIGLLSGILGFVLNTHLNHHAFFSFVPIRSLLYHFFMIFGAVLLWASRTYRRQAGDQWRSFIPIAILMGPWLILNRLYGYDYGYTAGGKGTPIEILSSALPKPVYLLVLYGGLFLLVWLLFYRTIPIRPKGGRS